MRSVLSSPQINIKKKKWREKIENKNSFFVNSK